MKPNYWKTAGHIKPAMEEGVAREYTVKITGAQILLIASVLSEGGRSAMDDLTSEGIAAYRAALRALTWPLSDGVGVERHFYDNQH